MKETDTDWLKWAGLEESPVTAVIAEAQKQGIPVFDDDRPQDIASRIHSYKTTKINKQLLYANIVLTTISIISAIEAIYPLLKT